MASEQDFAKLLTLASLTASLDAGREEVDTNRIGELLNLAGESNLALLLARMVDSPAIFSEEYVGKLGIDYQRFIEALYNHIELHVLHLSAVPQSLLERVVLTPHSREQLDQLMTRLTFVRSKLKSLLRTCPEQHRSLLAELIVSVTAAIDSIESASAQPTGGEGQDEPEMLSATQAGGGRTPRQLLDRLLRRRSKRLAKTDATPPVQGGEPPEAPSPEPVLERRKEPVVMTEQDQELMRTLQAVRSIEDLHSLLHRDRKRNDYMRVALQNEGVRQRLQTMVVTQVSVLLQDARLAIAKDLPQMGQAISETDAWNVSVAINKKLRISTTIDHLRDLISKLKLDFSAQIKQLQELHPDTMRRANEFRWLQQDALPTLHGQTES